MFPDYFQSIPYESMIITAVETFIIFWFTILTLRVISYRFFSQTSPLYLLFLLLLASGMYGGIAGRDPNLWNSFVTGIVLVFSVLIVQKFSKLRNWVNGQPLVLMSNGKLNEKAMKRTLIEKNDLNKMARQYGLPSYYAFKTIILETDGHLTGVLRPEIIKARFRKRD